MDNEMEKLKKKIRLVSIGEYVQVFSQFILVYLTFVVPNLILQYQLFQCQIISVFGQILMVKKQIKFQNEFDKLRYQLILNENIKKTKILVNEQLQYNQKIKKRNGEILIKTIIKHLDKINNQIVKQQMNEKENFNH